MEYVKLIVALGIVALVLWVVLPGRDDRDPDDV